VNFLLHHHFAARELSAAPRADLVAIGAMLPDLFRMARPRRHPPPAASVSESFSDEHRALVRGCEHHATIDKWFHASDAFALGERDLRHAFLIPESPKLVLFAHAAWEMCLDGAWLRQATIEERARVQQFEAGRRGHERRVVVPVAADAPPPPVGERRAQPLAAVEDEIPRRLGHRQQVGAEFGEGGGPAVEEGREFGVDPRNHLVAGPVHRPDITLIG